MVSHLAQAMKDRGSKVHVRRTGSAAGYSPLSGGTNVRPVGADLGDLLLGLGLEGLALTQADNVGRSVGCGVTAEIGRPGQHGFHDRCLLLAVSKDTSRLWLIKGMWHTAQEGKPLTTAAMETDATSGTGAPVTMATRVARTAAEMVIDCILRFYKREGRQVPRVKIACKDCV